MASVKRIGDIELNEDFQFQQRMWSAQRVAWTVFALILLATLLGLTGRGLLSSATAGTAGDPLWIEYDRFGRLAAGVSLAAYVNVDTESEQVRLWIDRSYLEAVQTEDIVPTPQSVTIASDRVYYVFNVAESGEPIHVQFELMPVDFGTLEGRVGLDGNQSLRFTQFIYP